ncbi:unnamed protein product [Sphenostylis stenocarpa]|uniref:Uncharacterized protein n=1 Tax=Sphenostylis stenocarpa TaxID=92480 RepID=A0AA86S0U3_9FABA|nr:unnamed protein product [Sphenostylis stenocarpa]
MASVVSRAGSEDDKSGLKHLKDKDSDPIHSVSSQLRLKSSQTLNKQEVLHRIRHRKSLNRIKGALESLLSSSEGNSATSPDHIWLQQYDVFSAP